jgi:hypothetical protein
MHPSSNIPVLAAAIIYLPPGRPYATVAVNTG